MTSIQAVCCVLARNTGRFPCRCDFIAIGQTLAEQRKCSGMLFLVATGTPPNRACILVELDSLQHTQQATLKETLDFVESEKLYGSGCGLVDMLLLASTMMTRQAELWTLDKRLSALADRFGVMHRPTTH